MAKEKRQTKERKERAKRFRLYRQSARIGKPVKVEIAGQDYFVGMC